MSGDSTERRGISAYLSPVAIEEQGEHSFRASGTIAEDCCVLRGHFPGRPVLPGAFHIWIALLLLGEVTGVKLRLRTVRKAKFRKLLAPRDAITVRCSFSPEEEGGLLVRCTIEKEGKEASKFTMLLVK